MPTARSVDAEALIRQFLLTHGNHVEGMRLLAKIGLDLDVADDAEFLLENALILAPNHHVARYEYALVLLKRHKHVQAREQMEMLLEDRSSTTGPTARRMRPFARDSAITTRRCRCYREVLAETPNDPELHLSIAHALKTLGRTAEAIESYRAAAAGRPRYRRGLLEPCQLEDLPLHRRRARAHARRRRHPRTLRWPTGITCVSRSAKRSRTAASTQNPLPITSAATH